MDQPQPAGVLLDDAVAALNGTAISGVRAAELEAIDQPASYRPVAWADATLRTRAWALAPVSLTVQRDGAPVDVTLTGTPACRSRFELRPTGEYGASADGDIVGITSAMLGFMVDDDELAAILAHEMAHNLLEHRKRLNAAGIQRGLMQQLGRNARLTLATEIEADRLSIWLMANAGYDPAGAMPLLDPLRQAARQRHLFCPDPLPLEEARRAIRGRNGQARWRGQGPARLVSAAAGRAAQAAGLITRSDTPYNCCILHLAAIDRSPRRTFGLWLEPNEPSNSLGGNTRKISPE